MRIFPAITCRRLFATNVLPRNRSFGFADALQTTDEMSRAGCGVFVLKRFYSATRSTKCQSAGKTEKHGIVKVIKKYAKASASVVLSFAAGHPARHVAFTDLVSKLLLWCNS